MWSCDNHEVAFSPIFTTAAGGVFPFSKINSDLTTHDLRRVFSSLVPHRAQCKGHRSFLATIY